MSISLHPVSSPVLSTEAVPSIHQPVWGGALTGPSKPAPHRPPDPAEVLRSAIRQAVVRDLRRLGEALREPCTEARRTALRQHIRFLLQHIDSRLEPALRLQAAAAQWRSDEDRHTVRDAASAVELLLAPPDLVVDDDVTVETAAVLPPEAVCVDIDHYRLTATRWCWLADDLDEADAMAVRTKLTSVRRAAVLLGRRRQQRRLLLLWS